MAGACALILTGAVYWLTRPSAEDVLNAELLTPAEIRYVATELLVDENLQMRRRASEKLVSIGESAVPVLKEVSLSCPDEKVRQAVLEILATIHPNQVAEVVGQMIGDNSAVVRRMAAAAAAHLPDDQRRSVVQQGIADPDAGVRLAAIESMGQRRDPNDIPVLTQSLKDPNLAVRRHAAHLLKMRTGRDYSNQIKRR